MKKPEFSYDGGIHRAYWEMVSYAGVRLAVSRIIETRDGLRGEWAWSLDPDVVPDFPNGGPLYTSNLNMLSPPSKASVARALDKRLNPDDYGVPWESMIEQACATVISEERKGEPVIRVGANPPRERAKYLVYPLVLDGMPTVIYGEGGSGKSMVATLCAVLAQYGLEHNNLQTSHPVNVLYLDWEADPEELNERVRAIAAGLGLPDAREIRYRYCHLPLTADIERIQELCVQFEIGMVVVDSIGAALGGDINDAYVALKFFNALRSLKVTALCVDHIASDKNAPSKPIGSIYKWNEARSLWEVKQSEESGDDQISIVAHHKKVNGTRKLTPFGMKISFLTNAETDVTDHIQFDIMSLREADISQLKGMPIGELIMNVLKREGRLSGGEISEMIGKPLTQVKSALTRLNKADRVVNMEGEWGVKVVEFG